MIRVLFDKNEITFEGNHRFLDILRSYWLRLDDIVLVEVRFVGVRVFFFHGWSSRFLNWTYNIKIHNISYVIDWNTIGHIYTQHTYLYPILWLSKSIEYTKEESNTLMWWALIFSSIFVMSLYWWLNLTDLKKSDTLILGFGYSGLDSFKAKSKEEITRRNLKIKYVWSMEMEKKALRNHNRGDWSPKLKPQKSDVPVLDSEWFDISWTDRVRLGIEI
jgi:hypothetical protein